MLSRALILPLLLLTLSGFLASGQAPPPDNDEGAGRKLPDRTEAILKQDHAASLKDLRELRRLSEELQMEFEKNDRHVLSLAAMKKLEEIEKISKRVRGRMKRY